MEREGLIRKSSTSTYTNAWLIGAAVTERREINQHCPGITVQVPVHIGRGISCTKITNNPPQSHLRKPKNIWISGWVSKKCGDLHQENTMKARKAALRLILSLNCNLSYPLCTLLLTPTLTNPWIMEWILHMTFQRCSLLVNDKFPLFLPETKD